MKLVTWLGAILLWGATVALCDQFEPAAANAGDIKWANGKWSWKPESLAWNCWTNALVCSNGAQGDFANMLLLTPKNITRHPNFWLRHLKGWPAYSVWNNCDTNYWPRTGMQTCAPGSTVWQRAGVLVTPEHVLGAGHMSFATNDWLAFMDMENRVVWRRVTDYFNGNRNQDRNNATTNISSEDYFIGLLNAPVPANIGYVKVIPTNWWAWFDAPFYNRGTNCPYHVPLLVWNCQHHTPIMNDLMSTTRNRQHIFPTFRTVTLTNWVHNTFQGGDSASPQFLALDGELCLFGITGANLFFHNPNAAEFQASLNATMRELSLRNRHTNFYTLTVKDLSKYPKYRQTLEIDGP